MDEPLSEQLGAILRDPQSMERIRNLAASLGVGDAIPTGAVPPSTAPVAPASQPMPAALDSHTLQTVTRLMPLLSSVRQEDDSTRLLRALRPLLAPQRQKKVDEALRLMQLMRLLPLLRQKGLFSGLLG